MGGRGMTVRTGLGHTVHKVRAEARDLHPSDVLLTVLMVLPFLIGWLIGQVSRGVWTIVAWIWTAGVVGWRTARQGALPPSKGS